MRSLYGSPLGSFSFSTGDLFAVAKHPPAIFVRGCIRRYRRRIYIDQPGLSGQLMNFSFGLHILLCRQFTRLRKKDAALATRSRRWRNDHAITVGCEINQLEPTFSD